MYTKAYFKHKDKNQISIYVFEYFFHFVLIIKVSPWFLERFILSYLCQFFSFL